MLEKFDGLEIIEDRDNHDYILSVTDLATLKGNKFYDKRNLVNLRAGGRFVSSFYEPQPSQVSQRLEKYGLTFSMPEPLQEGNFFHMIVRTDDEPLTFQDYYYPRATYEWAFRTAGFQEIRWHSPMVSPEGLQKFGQEFWQDYVENQVSIYLECVKR